MLEVCDAVVAVINSCLNGVFTYRPGKIIDNLQLLSTTAGGQCRSNKGKSSRRTRSAATASCSTSVCTTVSEGEGLALTSAATCRSHLRRRLLSRNYR